MNLGKLISSIVLSLALLFLGCQNESVNNNTSAQAPSGKSASQKGSSVFKELNPKETHVDFVNQLTPTKELHSFVEQNFIAGGGVAVLDANNDNLPDIFFTGNQVADRLYINKGDFKFEDISKSAGIGLENGWSRGVAIGDVNGDGREDIYVCKSLFENQPKDNLLYLNLGDGRFAEQSKRYGVGDSGFSSTATFFDMDLDGDLDLYVGNQPPGSEYMRQKLKGKIDYQYTDRLYRNDGGKFSNVTAAAGITNYTYTLSATVFDANQDGWPDLYIANDYEEPDQLLINQGNGSFKDMAQQMLGHMSTFSMGADISDINGDGLMDIFIADMVAADNFRSKTTMSAMAPEKFWSLVNNGYHYQYMFNTLQVNNGTGKFSEVAQLAGVSHSDWSWAPLFFDVDLDGQEDLFVSNGHPQEYRNNDYVTKQKAFVAESKKIGKDPYQILYELNDLVPQKKLKNYLFKKTGAYVFDHSAWEFQKETWSQGAAYADFNADGKLDLVVSNINEPASIFKNTSKGGNYLAISGKGTSRNPRGIGSSVEIETSSGKQYRYISSVKGYQSAGLPVAHFGTGADKTIKSVKWTWPDGRVSIKNNVESNQSIEFSQVEGQKENSRVAETTLLKKQASPLLIHKENVFDDYIREILIPHKMSTLGPKVISTEPDKTGTSLFYLCGSKSTQGELISYDTQGKFSRVSPTLFSDDSNFEDVNALFFDADGDGDEDLYVISGSNEFTENSAQFQDRLYINSGNNSFTKGKLPAIRNSGGVATAIDYDGDGDLDLFIGGRQIPGKYGLSPDSYLLNNNSGTFSVMSPNPFNELGMVTDAAVLNKNQLVIAGEWMPIQIWQWENNQMQKIKELKNSSGWWNAIEIADLNGDGHMDIIGGNLGLNIKFKASAEKPFKAYINDFDENGTHDTYLSYYDMDGKEYPVRGRECSSDQMPFVKEKFENYAEFASATVDIVLEGKMDGAKTLVSEDFNSAIFYGGSNSNFTRKNLPIEAQVSPIQDILVHDFNNDKKLDIAVIGNYYNREVETTRSDAGLGNILFNNGNMEFQSVHPLKSGLNSTGDARGITLLRNPTRPLMLVANNNGPLEAYEFNNQ